MTEPIRPEDVPELRVSQFPDEVIEVINDLIVKNYRNKRSRVMQKHIVEALEAKGFKRHEVFENNWLDVEDIYRRAGWRVAYDKPGYNESYEPSFTFVHEKIVA